MHPRTSLLMAALLTTAALGCAPQEPTAPLLAKGGAEKSVGVAPTTLTFALPGAAPAVITASVQFTGLISASSSNPACATASPLDVPATKPPGSSVYIATFTVTPVGAGTCIITVTDKKGGQAEVAVTVTAIVAPPALNRIVYSTNADGVGGAEVYVMDDDGGNVQRVTLGNGADTRPTLAPDGAMVAFSAFRTRPGGTSVTDVFLVDIDGQNEHQLTMNVGGGQQPRYSPDGSKVVFANGLHHIWIIDTDGQNEIDLSAVSGSSGDSEASFSPDGLRLVFSHSSATAGLSGLWIANSDGTSRHQITSGSGHKTPAWSPDGLSILYTQVVAGVEGIHQVGADGNGDTRLTAGTVAETDPRWAPDGSRMLFRRGLQLLVRDLDGANEVPLLTATASIVGFDWK